LGGSEKLVLLKILLNAFIGPDLNSGFCLQPTGSAQKSSKDIILKPQFACQSSRLIGEFSSPTIAFVGHRCDIK